jgi:hypothetical protein
MANAAYTAPGNKQILSNIKQIIYCHVRGREKYEGQFRTVSSSDL